MISRADLSSLRCYAVAGAGTLVGPDLAAIGSSTQLDYLLESILLPSKVIREGYTTARVITRSGRALGGVVVRESAQELVLRNPVDGEIFIPTRDIEERTRGGSLMPDGLDQFLTDSELADLVRFL